jgi:hypothetical protein
VKPIHLNQLLFHPNCDSLSFFLAPNHTAFDGFINDMEAQLNFQGKTELASLLEQNRNDIKKIISNHPSQSHGFFLSELLKGYVVLTNSSESFWTTGHSFQVRPLLEEFFSNPEYMVINISLYDIKIYRGDFHHLEIIQSFDYDQLPKSLDMNVAHFFTPQYLGLIPYRTVYALKTIAGRIKDLVLYNSLPVIVTGLREIKEIFLRYFNYASGIVTNIDEDFYEKSCVQIVNRCKSFRSVVLDYYSERLKERLKNLTKSKRVIFELREIIVAVQKGRVNHLILPLEKKIFGAVNFITGEFEIHSNERKRTSVDILNQLAEAVIKDGGRIQHLGHHFFPPESNVLAILKGRL